METLDWSNAIFVVVAKNYFDKYVTGSNLHDIHRRNVMKPQNLNDNPCVLNREHIFSWNDEEDYENLVNHVQRHIKCIVDSCLCKKGFVISCCYHDP